MARLYLHYVREYSSGYGSVTVWLNGFQVYEGILKSGDYNQTAIPLELRKGKNKVLVKYEFSRFRKLNVLVGDTYGAPVSYLK